MKTHCLSCKYYKIHDALSGSCRVEKLASGKRNTEKPVVKAESRCDKWKDGGQTYYIRLGWIRNLEKKISP